MNSGASRSGEAPELLLTVFLYLSHQFADQDILLLFAELVDPGMVGFLVLAIAMCVAGSVPTRIRLRRTRMRFSLD